MASANQYTASAGITPLFNPVRLGSIDLANRMAVAPMTRVSATADGVPTADMVDYYRAFAEGGFGLIISEGIYTDKAYAQGYINQPGLTDPRQRAGWAQVVDQVHRAGGRVIAQLMHAGGLSQGNPHREGSVAPSSLQPKGAQLSIYRGDGDYCVPREMSLAEIEEARQGFVSAAVMARAAGFDGVEIHGANGYLLDQFLTEGVNCRSDDYGGSVAVRARLLTEVLSAVQAAVGVEFTVGVRLSQAKVNDFQHRWSGEAEAEIVFRAAAAAGADYIHTTEFEAWRPAFEGGHATFAELARIASGLPIVANGGLHNVDKAVAVIASGATVVSIGRGALANADWPARIAGGGEILPFNPDLLYPVADLANSRRVRSANFS